MKRIIVLSTIVVGLAIVSAADAAIVTSMAHRSDCDVISTQFLGGQQITHTSVDYDNSTNLETSFAYAATCGTTQVISTAGAESGATYTAFVSETNISSSGSAHVESFGSSSWSNTAIGRARLLVTLTPDVDLIYSFISPSITGFPDNFSNSLVQLVNTDASTVLYQLSDQVAVVGSSTGILLAGVAYQVIGATSANLASVGFNESVDTAYSFQLALTPVPIPATAPLLVTGLAMVLARARRRRLRVS